MAKVEHFEIPADDMQRAQDFYGAVFDFPFESWGDDMGILRTGGDTGEGINGDLHKRELAQHPTIVITVDRIEHTVAKAVEKGGEQVGEIQLMGDTGRYTYLRDSEGNLIGLYDDQGTAA